MKLTLLVLCLAPVMLVAQNKSAKSADKGTLKFSVTPSKAGVFLDGVYMGPASLKYKLPPDKYQITLVDPRFEDATVSVQVEAGKTATVTETLKPKAEPKGPYGELQVACPYKLAAVMLNDRFVGHVSEFRPGMRGLMVTPGNYNVLIELAGGEAILEQVVTIAADKTTLVQQGEAQP
jgi:hypothetical protein